MKNNLLLIGMFTTIFTSCIEESKPTASDPSVSKKNATIQTDSDGWTVEQKNIAKRLERDNKVGAIKHLYVISPYSGQVILYSTVKGKVTSSGKRLTPTSVKALDGQFSGVTVNIGGKRYKTEEVLQDDGAYGSSCQYIYWFDSRDVYHSHFFTGGQIIHVSEQPIPVANITLNLEQQ